MKCENDFSKLKFLGGLVVHEHDSAPVQMAPNVVPSTKRIGSFGRPSSQSTNLLYVSKLWWIALY